jgi:hypothetical protein
METKILAFTFVLLYTVYCKPTDSSLDGYVYDDFQNDNNNYGGDYDDVDEESEQGNVPDVPLSITTAREDFIRNLSETVILPCAITGRNYVQIWRKKNVIHQDSKQKDAVLFQSGIRMAAAPNTELLPDGSIKISNLHVQDAGEYECAAMDTKKNSPKIAHKLILNVPPRIKLLMAKNNQTILKSGETLILTCKAEGYPKPNISWHKNSQRFDVQGEELEIPNIRHREAGTYKCLADNKIGEPAFSYINIHVEFKPIVTVARIIVSSENNSETELECLVHSDPPAKVNWTKDGADIVNNQRIQLISNQNKHNLVLKDLRDSDFGEYTCSAWNTIGASKKTIKLVKTPAILRCLKSRTDAKEMVLTWEVQSKSNISEHEFVYRRKGDKDWIRVNPEVNFVGNEIYTARYVFDTALDPGEYETRIRSQNYNGWSEFSEAISFEEVYAKHGHHKSYKKGQKHGKDKQFTSTQSNLPLESVPAEHQEGDVQATISGCSSTRPTIFLISIALIAFLQNRKLSARI